MVFVLNNVLEFIVFVVCFWVGFYNIIIIIYVFMNGGK